MVFLETVVPLKKAEASQPAELSAKRCLSLPRNASAKALHIPSGIMCSIGYSITPTVIYKVTVPA